MSKQNNVTRLLSLDVFRGITIVGMILVNSPGNQTAYPMLEHSAWNGCTLADLVFPFFLFIVGVSLVFSLSKQRALGIPTKVIMIKVLKRSIIIFLLGLFLNAFPKHMNFATLRLYGVLPRIAICYYFTAFLFLTTRLRTQILICVGLLVGYWLLMTLTPVPGFGINNLTEEGNLAAYLDRLIFSSEHLYAKIFDPEGILSTFPAIGTTLLGSFTGVWLLTQSNHQKKLIIMLIAGIVGIASGWMWGWSFPINKALWTSSFVLWTAGWSLCLLGLCYWLLEIKHWERWSIPFKIFAMNAIAAYFLHIFFLKIQHLIILPNPDGAAGNLRLYTTTHVFGWTTPENASLLYALSYILLWLFILSILYRHRIFIKI